MSNPFDDLKRKRDEGERKRQMEENLREKEIAEKQRVIATENTELTKRFNGLVTEVLEDLRSAIYPNCTIKVEEFHRTWTIGNDVFSDEDGYHFVNLVSVQLGFDRYGKVSSFECSLPGKRRWASAKKLTKESLTDALKSLHSEPSPEKPKNWFLRLLGM